MKTHEYAEAFPMATESELAEMASDIKQRGLLCPIITLDGKVLDGRNRLRACEIAGVAPRFQEYVGADPLADVVSWNLKRRHLTPSQQAGIGADVANMKREDTLMQGSRSADLPNGKLSQAEAAKMVGVSERLVRDAVKVKKAAPELYEEVKAGRMTVNAAKQKIRETEQAEERTANRKEETRPKSRGVALLYVGRAIAEMQRIPPDDGLRKDAWSMMRGWLDNNE
jgi:ParB-like chromosome segregation protein Spo0J